MNHSSCAAYVFLPNLPLWKDVKTFADLGGGNGHIALAIAKANTHLDGIVLDLL